MASVDDPRVEQHPVVAAGGDPEAPLRSYLAAKQAVAQLLREIRQLAERSAPWAAERVRDIMVRLAEDRFQLIVVGQFKRGKTSLMNAIIGRPLLPTGTIPVTSAITSLRYGSALRAVVRRAGQAIDQEVPIPSLPDFITERGNPENRKQVLSADVEVPAPFLRRGLQFVDTPGIGSAHEHNTATTLAFLPEADAAIFVTGADAPLSEGELEFLDAVRQHVRKLFFVLNKIDHVNAGERDEVLTYTSRLLARRLGVEAIRLFPLSAARVLAAEATDTDALAASGLAAFESALAAFLDEDRRRVFLVAVLDRALKVLEEMRFTLDVRRCAISSSPDAGDRAADLNRRYEEQEQQRRAAVDRAAQLIERWQEQVLEPALTRFDTETTDALSADLPSAAPAWPAGRRSEEAAASWLREQLQQRGGAWLRSMTDSLAEIVHAMAHELEPEIGALIESTFAIAGSVFGVAQPTHAPPSGDRGVRHWTWKPPAFETPDAIAGIGDGVGAFPHVPLPHAVAVRLATRRIARRLPQDVSHVGDVLRQLVLGYLRARVADLDASSARALADERRRVDQAIEPESPTGGVAARKDVIAAVAQLDTLVARATAARDALIREEPLEQALSPAAPIAGVPVGTSEPIAQERVTTTASRVATGTCAICAAASDAVFNFLCHHQYAIAVDRAAQQQLSSAHGLCPTHTWVLERIASPRGLSMGYPSLLDETAERMQAMAGGSIEAVVNGIRSLLSSTSQCAACLAKQHAERAAAHDLVRQLETTHGRAAFLQSHWLCLNHLQFLITALDGDVAADLVRAHARVLGEVAESMREYVLKVDARRRGLLTAEEERAYRQALVLLAGERNLAATLPEE